MGPEDVSDVTHRKRGLRILGFDKKQWVEFLPPNERVDIQSWARTDEFVRYGRKSSQHWKIVSLSPHVEKPLNSKVNKSFIPEPISCFRIPIYVYEHFMNIISISHIRIMGILHLLVVYLFMGDSVNNHNNLHLVVLIIQGSLTLSDHQSLSSIIPGRSSRLRLVSAQSWCL